MKFAIRSARPKPARQPRPTRSDRSSTNSSSQTMAKILNRETPSIRRAAKGRSAPLPGKLPMSPASCIPDAIYRHQQLFWISPQWPECRRHDARLMDDSKYHAHCRSGVSCCRYARYFSSKPEQHNPRLSRMMQDARQPDS